MPNPLNFQSVILKLQHFWAEQGCVIVQPYYTQVGAGTMNPATFLRVLGPEPWNVAYVEPSVRPDDGRYGENPNRFQVHYQFQVILKPDPGNPQELYLQSLAAIGIDPRAHDIRFVEDNWEQPAISAWGLGWEVWLDGQEITQFTYFQQMGGVALDPVSVEITYGLERILIGLHNVQSAWDLPWNETLKYGEVRRVDEFEHSKYYFDVADVDRLRQMYDLYEREAKAAIDAGLILPAHDYVLKCSHTFNVLDTRGAIGVTERQFFFGKMREMARKVALAYMEQRKQLEYPWLKETKDEGQQTKASLPSSSVLGPSSFVLEVGVEELPATDLDAALEQLNARVPTWLDELRLEHGAVTIHGTPRRLIVHIDSLAARQPDLEQVVKGPPADKAFDKSGVATPAAMGFAKKNGMDTKDLQVREMDGGKYVVAVVKQAGRPTAEVLKDALPALVASIKFDKTMKWNASGVAFSRPLRWFVALLGETVIPFSYAGLTASNVSRGLRPYNSPEFVVPSVDQYFALLREYGIVYDHAERRALIEAETKRLAESLGGEAIIEAGLLDEVTNLVEKPMPLIGHFDEEFLSLPTEVLVSVMKKHQRYFPVEGRKSKVAGATFNRRPSTLLPHFIVVRNGDDQHLDLVREGNEHVIRARFTDANFFVRDDIKHKLKDFRPKLATLSFQKKLGSMLDKADRMVELSLKLASMLDIHDEAERINVKRAAYLAKADLMSHMVVEMTSLQGIMGREYARRSGENETVAVAIGEQYQPVPQTKIGLAVALADRLDSLVGLFAAGLAPSGAKDPFGLRRAAIGTVQPLIEHDLNFDLRDAVRHAAELQPIPVSAEVQTQVLDFIAGRLSVVLKESYRYDVVDAVLVSQSENPASAARAVKQLQAWVARADWSTILPGYARCVRILRSQTVDGRPQIVDPKVFSDEAEQNLYQAFQAAVHRPPSTVDEFLNNVVTLLPAINTFFDKVLVMAEDEAVKKNRLALVGQVANLSYGLADLSKLEGF